MVVPQSAKPTEQQQEEEEEEEEEEEKATVKPDQLAVIHDVVFSYASETKNPGVTEDETAPVRIDNGSPKPMEGLPPPFLKKTFEMVSDPGTDPIVSWSETRDSFVVWDSHQFSKTLLPKYFKHTNFSSFIRQLNIYGFKKVDSDRWEFANGGFQGGKRHLLKNIKRRTNHNKLHQGQGALNPILENDEVEELKKDQNIVKLEILKLRQEHEDSQVQLTSFEERVRSAELKQYQMLIFLARMAIKPTMVEQLVQKMKQKSELDGVDMVKRRRLIGTNCPVSFPKAMETNPIEQLATLQSEIVNTSRMEPPAPSPSGLRVIDSGASARDVIDVSSAYHVMSEKLMGESSVVGGEIDVNDSNIYLELEDLMSKAADWVGFTSGLVGQST